MGQQVWSLKTTISSRGELPLVQKSPEFAVYSYAKLRRLVVITLGLYLAALLSFVNNPGFNKDRGPVVIPGFRIHLDF
jgi:hypothetical protein